MEEREEKELQSDSKTALENSAERGFASLPRSGGGGGGGGGARALSGAGSWERGRDWWVGLRNSKRDEGTVVARKCGTFDVFSVKIIKRKLLD